MESNGLDGLFLLDLRRKKMEKPAFEPTGLVPRSIIRTLERFRQQLLPEAEVVAVQEFRISRYQLLVSIKCLLTLLLIPIGVSLIVKVCFIRPVTEYFWNGHQTDLFLNSYQQGRALQEMEDFSEKLFFESLIEEEEVKNSKNPDVTSSLEGTVQRAIQQKTLQLALIYNDESVVAITNLCSDFIAFSTLALLFFSMRPQIIILKSFLTESIYSLSDTTKSFLLILLTDLLVGFHSPRGWEISIELLLQHFGWPENQDFIFLFVATFPVFLDTVFKYWIFRYLNKISPSTVATYHNMIE
jgi:hypothetical protein